MCAELPRRSQDAYVVQKNCVYFPLVIIEKHSSVDVASTLEVNHVKSECYAIDSCVVFSCYICHSLHELCLQLKCMYALFSSQHYRRINIS